MIRTPPIPTGTVTLLFTDVEGSTRLWESEPEAMATALRRHDELLRTAVETAGGYVFKTVGDAFCAAFSTAPAALGAVLHAQRALGREPWPTQRPLRVRMGLHTGACEERDDDYFGPVVNRAARLEAVAHGGQVLVSGATAELLSEGLPEAVNLRDLGSHRLKDLGRPEQVFQLEAEFLPTGFPALRSLDNPELPNNLPDLLSAFVGRERELAEVRALVESSRLVTFTGAGGSGKTRLALQVAAELLEGAGESDGEGGEGGAGGEGGEGGGGEGVWLVELAPIADPEHIPAAVASILGVQDPGDRPVLDALVDALTEQDVLLILDNCEHVIDATAAFAEVVSRHCPKVRLLATSREPLGIDGERVYRVPSLSLPPSDAEAVADLESSDAVRLFVERARVQDSGFAVAEEEVTVVASICRRLDGIPLALELAAARLSSMSLVHLSERLDQRFRLLTGGSRNAMPRQQTLQATVDWSFDLLDRPERAVLRRLSVFVGGFELEAAEAVCQSADVDAFDVADLLGSLVEKSLVVADRADGSVRYRLLETIRQYSSQELLRDSGEPEVLRVRDRHASFFLRLAETAAPELRGPRQAAWLRRLDLEWDNLRAAFVCLEAEPDRLDDLLRLGVAVQRLVLSRGHTEVLVFLRSAVERAPASPSPLLNEALLATSTLVGFLLAQKDPAELQASGALAERALAMADALGDLAARARALGLLAAIAYLQRDLPEATRLAEEAIAISRRLGDTQLLGEMLRCIAVTLPPGEARRASRLESLECFRDTGDVLFATGELYSLAGVEIAAGSMSAARAYLAEAMASAEDLGAEMFLYFFRMDLAVLFIADEDFEAAAPLLRRSLLQARRIGVRQEMAGLLFASACWASHEGDAARAARLHGAADVAITSGVASGNMNWTTIEERLREEDQARLRASMTDEGFESAYAAGAALTRHQSLELALGRYPAV